MLRDIKFHCDAKSNFPNDCQPVHSFSYDDYRIEPHNHDFYEVNIIMKGKGIHEIENSAFEVKTGDVFVIPPMIVHAYHHTENLEVHHILLHKRLISDNRDEAVKVRGFLQLMEIEPFLRANSYGSMFLHLSQSQLIQLKSDLKYMEDNDTFNNDNFIPLKYHTTWKILYWFSYLLYEQINSNPKNTSHKYEQSVIQSLEYIHQHFAEKITVDLLYKRTFLSRSTFLRSFYAICGCMPIQYLNDYRYKKALEMLENTLLTKTEVAHRCGFYDLSHMERSLKSHPLNKSSL